MSRGRAVSVGVLLIGLSACGDDAETDGSGGAGGATSNAAATTTAANGTTGSSSGQTTGGSSTSAGGGSSSSSSTTTGSATTSATTTGSSTTSGSGGGSACLQDLSAGHHEVACEGGITYEVEIPAACTGGGCGLVVDMHGYTMSADAQDENTGMRALGQQHGYVVVQPTAPADNFGLASWDQPAHAPLVHQFLVDVAAGLTVDAARIHAMGFSQGGGMTFRLLCRYADFFASGASIGGIAGCEFSGPNTPSEEVDILQVHGRTDAVVNFGSVAIPQRDAVLAAWDFGAPAILEEDGEHRATRWVTSNATVLELWEHDYETSAEAFFVPLDGHCVPGGQDFDGVPAGYSCEDQGTFVFGVLAMAFFQAHPKD